MIQLVSKREVVKFAFAYTGVVVGAGFSTGQEIIQFFTNYGLYSFFGTLLAGLLVVFVGRQSAKLGSIFDVESHEVPLYKLFGKPIGAVIDYILAFFMYGIAVIMIAGSGANLEEGFGIPAAIGSIITLILVFITLLMDFEKIMSILGAITPVLLIMVIIMAVTNLIIADTSFTEAAAFADVTKTPNGIWWIDAIVYMGAVMGVAFSFLSIMGADADKYDIAKKGSLIGGFIVLFLLVLMNTSLLTVLQEANVYAIPALVMANNVHPLFGSLYSILIIALIYNTVVGLMYAFLARFTTPRSKNYKIMLIISLVVAYVFTFIGFVDLVNFFYPIFGYLGIVLGFALIILWMRKKLKEHYKKSMSST